MTAKSAPPFPPLFQNDQSVEEIPGARPLHRGQRSGPCRKKRRRSPPVPRTAGRPPSASSKWVAENIGYAIPGGGSRPQDLRHAGPANAAAIPCCWRPSAGPWASRPGSSSAPCTPRISAAASASMAGTRSTWDRPAGSRSMPPPLRPTTSIRGISASRSCESAAANAFNGREIKVLDHRLANAGGSRQCGTRRIPGQVRQSAGRPDVHRPGKGRQPGPRCSAAHGAAVQQGG